MNARQGGDGHEANEEPFCLAGWGGDGTSAAAWPPRAAGAGAVAECQPRGVRGRAGAHPPRLSGC